jgi:hypothetical protein
VIGIQPFLDNWENILGMDADIAFFQNGFHTDLASALLKIGQKGVNDCYLL